MIKYSLRGFIRKVLYENSGGIKFTALIAEVVCAWHEGEIVYSENPSPDVILKECKKDFKMLRYEWKISKKETCGKIFIYQKAR